MLFHTRARCEVSARICLERATARADLHLVARSFSDARSLARPVPPAASGRRARHRRSRRRLGNWAAARRALHRADGRDGGRGHAAAEVATRSGPTRPDPAGPRPFRALMLGARSAVTGRAGKTKGGSAPGCPVVLRCPVVRAERAERSRAVKSGQSGTSGRRVGLTAGGGRRPGRPGRATGGR
jgi:hypothetical protein